MIEAECVREPNIQILGGIMPTTEKNQQTCNNYLSNKDKNKELLLSGASREQVMRGTIIFLTKPYRII